MSVIDEVLAANTEYSRDFTSGNLPVKPARKLATVACMDARKPVAPAQFQAFPNLEANVRQQAQKVKSHPWVPRSIAVRGFNYDVKTGRLNEVPARGRRPPGLNHNPN